jgi:hypothetical protein
MARRSTRNVPPSKKKRRKRRSAVEPKIGHLKSANRMNVCFLKGLAGDAINAMLAAEGSDLQKIVAGDFVRDVLLAASCSDRAKTR